GVPSVLPPEACTEPSSGVTATVCRGPSSWAPMSATLEANCPAHRTVCGAVCAVLRASGERLLSTGAEARSALAEALVAVLELLHAAGGVEDALLAGVERVRSGRDLDVDHRVGVAVFPLDGLLARGGGAGEELGAVGQIVEHDRGVLRMDVLLH